MQNSAQHPLQGYFSEISPQWPGQIYSLKMEGGILYHEKSPYQDIMVFTTEKYGNVLVLDGLMQCAEKDEVTFQEMIAHLPLFCHPSPKNVLIVGGGDGGVLREVDKHPEVETIHLCEIDEKVIEVSKKYLSTFAIGFKSPKLTVHIEDGVEFVGKHKEEFDVIITDSTDPIGPAVALFEKPYYEQVYSALKPDGILCCQGESFWYHGDLIKRCISSLKSIFPVVGYSWVNVSSNASGQMGLFVASKNKNNSLRIPLRTLSEEQKDEWDLMYYNSKVHEASFVVPRFVKKTMLQ